MATPHITGILAQLFQSRPGATPAQIENALKSSAFKYGPPTYQAVAGGFTSSFDRGTGLVDVTAAVSALGGCAP